RAGVAEDRQIDLVGVGDDLGIEIDLYDPAGGLLRGTLPVHGGDGSHAAADIDDEIGILQRPQGMRVEAVVADDPDAEAMVVAHWPGRVVTPGTSMRSASDVSAADAPERFTPPPATISGLRAASSAATPSAMASGCGWTR